jgi:AcrR family transcriptional regulator
MGDLDRRQLILKAADRLLRHYGPHKTTIADVAREANVGVGTVYLEFPSKESLIEELSQGRHRDVLEAMRAVMSAPRKSYRQRLEGVLEVRVTRFLAMAEEGAHACDLVHCVSPAVMAASARFRDGERALVLELVRAAGRAGEFDVRKPEVCASTILRAYASFSPPWMFSVPRQELLAALAAMHELVFVGLLRRGPGLSG